MAAGLAAGSPEPVLIGTAFLVLAVVGILGGQAVPLRVSILEWPQSMIEGEERRIRIRFESEGRAGRTYADLKLSRGMSVIEADGARVFGDDRLMIPAVGQSVDVIVTVKASTWGRHRIGPISTYTEAPLSMFDVGQVSADLRSWVVVPQEVALKRLLSPLETNLHSGDLVSRLRGSGSEFADLRSYAPGDDPRHINWRVSSRSDGLWVNERHPERNGDVILLVDAQVESNTGLVDLVDRSVRLGAALLQGHARRRHRLGLITLDGMCRWLGPGSGEFHRRRLLEQLLTVQPGQVLWEAVERAVVRAAKRPALVVALTPLLDPNMAGLLNVLRRSGIDVVAIEIDATHQLTEPETGEREIGRRIWALERDRIRDRLSGVGIPVVIWARSDPPEVPLHQLDVRRSSWRRQLG
ncbi:MAG: DUF58 domain-containing protein [Acidimicrobiia bacterium]